MHLKRLVVALIVLPLFYFYIMYLPAVFYIFLLMAVSLIALSEFYSMYHVEGTLRHACLLFGAAIIAVSYYVQVYLPDFIMFSAMSVMCIRLFIRKNPLSALSDISPALIGLLYVTGLLTFQTWIRNIGPQWIIFLYATVWSSDSVAYYIGKGFGKRRLYREVSPNKTVAGAIGSLIGGILGAFLFKATLIPTLTVSAAMITGILIGSISIIGDLVESMFKRDAGVKDSSSIIPGHGGVLDKIDGSLFAGPVLYWTLRVMGLAG